MLVGTLQGGWFIQNTSNKTFIDQQLVLPEGKKDNFFQ